MSAQTPIYGITYPTESDLVRDVHQHMQTVATTVESALHEVDQRATPAGSTPVIAQTFDQLSQMPGVTGQNGYVTNDTERNGLYVWDGHNWYRGGTTNASWGGAIDFVNNAGWDATESRAYLFMGMLLLHISARRKTEDWVKNAYQQEKIAELPPSLCPPQHYHFTGYATYGGDTIPPVGISVQTDGGVMIEALANGMRVKKGALLTCACVFPTTQF